MRKKITSAHVIASISLFISLGGTATAAIVLSGKNIRDGSLTGADIKDGSVRARDIDKSLLAETGDPQPGATGPKGETGPQGERGPSGITRGAVLQAVTATSASAVPMGEFPIADLRQNTGSPITTAEESMFVVTGITSFVRVIGAATTIRCAIGNNNAAFSWRTFPLDGTTERTAVVTWQGPLPAGEHNLQLICGANNASSTATNFTNTQLQVLVIR